MAGDKSLKNKGEEIDLPLSTDWKPSFEKQASDETKDSSQTEAHPEKPYTNEQENAPGKITVDEADKKPVKICPKCGHKNENFFSCDVCGLIFRKWQYSEDKTADETNPKIQLEANRLWQNWLNDTSNNNNLDLFHNYCIQNNATKIAAQEYRLLLLKDPKNQLVLNYQQKIVNKVMADFSMVPSPKNNSKDVSLKTIIIAILIMVLVSAVSALFLVDYAEKM